MNLMRPIIVCSIFILPMLGISTPANAQPVSESREWTDTYPLATGIAQLQIQNIWGDVEVSQGDPGQIVVSVKEIRSAPNQKLFNRSLEVLSLRTDFADTGVKLIVGQEWGSWKQHQSCRDCRVEYQFDVQVPPDTDIDVSTVNDGKVNITGVLGKISASNVNGPIHVSGAQHCRSFNNINGVVDINFAENPGNDCDIETINGDINLTMPASAGIDLALDQSNGRVNSEFPVDAINLPAKVDHIQKDGVNRYRIQQAAGLRLAGGGNTFTISSLNGDIRIQKAQAGQTGIK